MKTAILTFVMILGVCGIGAAQTEETLSITAGQQKLADRQKLHIKFVSVMEDSRCPVRVVCVWAGNARVKIEISLRHRGTKTIILNTGLDPRTDTWEGYQFRLISVTPKPGEQEPEKAALPQMVIAIRRL